MSQPQIACVPLTLPVANRAVSEWHRHHAPIPGGFAWWAVGAVADGRLCGIAIAGRPTNRNNDDRLTVEVLRLATDGTENACSALLGACGRAAKAIGARRCITYTLDSEGGASIRGAGWVREADGIESWWTHAGSRTPAVDREHMRSAKVRWALHFTGRPSYVLPWSDETESTAQGELFAGGAA